MFPTASLGLSLAHMVTYIYLLTFIQMAYYLTLIRSIA